jgi:hypothetical protein
MQSKKTRLRSLNHAASNASKALLEVLTARGQEIKVGLKLSACGTESWFDYRRKPSNLNAKVL